NIGPARSATVTIANRPFALNQASGCTVTLASASAAVPAAGGAASVAVQTEAGCAWTIANSASWVSVATAVSNSGPGTAQFTVAPNTGPARSATVTIADRPFAINQASG